ncbi:MAG: hypothetical protein ISR58_12640 [Anaerolineales bacterium]|nr:hypothetical protein [Chloroflexota bacterium]MBL6982026.1 hypothetical protein [Anaerolineales bacterium]
MISQKMVWGFVLVLLSVALGACNMPVSNILSPATATNTATLTYTSSVTPSITPSLTATKTATQTFTLTSTLTPVPTDTLTLTDTPHPTDTPTITLTPTPEKATAEADGNINCRWGPNTVYLVAGLFREGAVAQVDGRDYGGNWLWIQMEDFSYHCWVSTSAVIVNGDIDTVPFGPMDPPINSSVSSATGVGATRDGNKVIVTWNAASSAVDLHYLIKANICNGTYVLEWVDVTTRTSYTLQDKSGCSGSSSAKLFVVNKLGYSSPVLVPWP